MRLSNLNIKSSVISKSILPFVGLLLLSVYLFCFWPYFVNLESKSFYSGVAAFLLPLWQQIGGGAEVLSRFCIQFYAYPWGVIGVLSLWAVVWYILCAKNLSLFGVLAWPVFLLLAKGSLPQVVFLMGLTLSLISLWGQKKIKNFYLSYGLWFLGSVLLYYFSGISSLLFSIPGACALFFQKEKFAQKGAVIGGLLLLFILPWAFSQTLFLCSLESAYGLPILKNFSIEIDIALLILLFLLCMQNSTAFLQYRKSAPYVAISGLFLSAFSLFFVYHQQRLERVFLKVENAITDHNWEKALYHGNLYYKKHAQDDFSNPKLRLGIATYMKLALIKNNQLNDLFLSYYRVPEMGSMLPFSLPYWENFNILMAQFYFETGLYVPAMSTLTCLLEEKGLQNETIKKMIPTLIYVKRFALAENYLYYLKHSLPYSNLASYWEIFNSEEASNKSNLIKWKREQAGKTYHEEKPYLDDWVVETYSPLSFNQDLLNYYTLITLLNKNLTPVPALVAHYKKIQAKRLPTYLQEAVLLSINYKEDPKIRRNALQKNGYMGFAFDRAVLDQFDRMYKDVMLYNQGIVSASALERHYADTYFFHYLFGKFL